VYTQDFILNGVGHGALGELISPVGGSRFDPGMHRPYFDRETRWPCVTINTGRDKWNPKSGRYDPVFEQVAIKDLQEAGIYTPAFNAATLEKQQWIQLDKTIITAARQRLRAWGDLSAASPYGGFDGMQKTLLEHQTTNDPGEALVDMDGLSEGRNDQRTYQLEGVPLPITHSSFRYNKRELEISRSSGVPLNVRDAEAAARRVAEKIEQTLIGIAAGMDFGGTVGTGALDYSRAGKVYGYTTYPDRATGSLTTPLGTNPEATVDDVLEMRDALYDNGFYGPFMLYTSKNWDRYMDNDYQRLVAAGNSVGGTMTLRDRIRRIEGVQDVRRLDFFTGTAFQLVLVQMTQEVAQAVTGMEIVTIQWETQGGMQLHFKCMTIAVPRIFSDSSGNCGIAHFTN
jgi:uncharacterized protein DUF6260